MENMFSGNVEKKVPKSFSQCYETDNTSRNLWIWCERLEKFGKILLWVIIIFGTIIAVSSSISTEEVTKGYYYTYTEEETSFDFALFIVTLTKTVIYAFVEYCIYHVLALLIAALATIVQNTRITANVALFVNSKAEKKVNEEEKGMLHADLGVEEFSVENKDVCKNEQCTEEFLREIQNTSTASLKLILKDQKDLYSAREMSIIKEELSKRKDEI